MVLSAASNCANSKTSCLSNAKNVTSNTVGSTDRNPSTTVWSNSTQATSTSCSARSAHLESSPSKAPTTTCGGMSTLTQVNASRRKRVGNPTAKSRNASMQSALRNSMASIRFSVVGAAWSCVCSIDCRKTTAVRDKSQGRFAYKTQSFLTNKSSLNPHQQQSTLTWHTLEVVYLLKNLRFRP